MGEIINVTPEGTNRHLDIRSALASELKIDQSVCHNGVCLTVVDVAPDYYRVTAIDETLRRSNLGQLATGDKVNLERCMPANGRFDGHIVQGHVDQLGTCKWVQEQDGSWLFDFSFNPTHDSYMTVEKGSVTINGVSLTCFNSTDNSFTVAIIPYTYDHTNFHQLQPGDTVNLEFDIVGKYIYKMMKKMA